MRDVEPLSLADDHQPAMGAPVAYIMSRFPRVTETFILRELLELERQGQPVVIFPLLRVQQAVRHAEVDRLMSKVHYTPFLSLAILSAHLHYLRRSPRQYVKTLWSALKGTWGSTNLFMGAMGIFPKSVYLARLIEERGIKHVHAHFATHPALAALIISELSGVGFSFTAHAHDIFVHTKMLAEKMEKARFVATISEFNKQYLLRLSAQTPESKIKVIRCGIEMGRYSRADEFQISNFQSRAEEPLSSQSDDPLTILCVASLQPYKGIEYLVNACALLKQQLPHLQCLIVGEGEERDRLERLITQLGLPQTVHLLGARPQSEVTAWLAQADLFVLPSVVAPNGQMEGLPVALMEAMASRLPVVATRLSGIPELVQDGVTGLLVPPRNAWALARAITLLYERKHLRQEMGRRGREKVAREFELTNNVAKLRTLFSAILDQQSEPKEWMLELKEKIKERTAKYCPGFGHNGRVDVHLSRLNSGRDSEVYEVALTNGNCHGRRLVLKLHRPAWARPEEVLQRAGKYAQREYDALSFLWREFSQRSTRFTVPRPLDHFPEYAALVVEKCQGEKLNQALRWARLLKTSSERERLCQQVKTCGEWLALFHQVTGRPGNPSGIYQRIERDFYNDLKACEELGLDPALAAQVVTWFEQKKSVAFSGDHRIVGYHCDFGPYNVFLSQEKITVIDFEGLQEGIIYDDLCYFLGMIEAMPFYHLSRKLSQNIKESFLEGYGQPEKLDQGQFDVFVLMAMVKIMAHSPLLKRGTGWRHAWKRQQRLKFYTNWFEEQVG
jgi:glycosyltransferase involved in cell wall biosynthesis/Ser/Thr protein kinase RdoA (MazF antagonist)